MPNLLVRTTVNAARKELANIKKQTAFATSQTINTMAFGSKKDIDTQIKQRIDRPTRFIQRAIEVDKSTRATLKATVKVGTRQNRSALLGHLFTGGTRRGKPYEGALRGMGVLPRGMYTVPGEGAPINAFGNIRKAFLNKLINQLLAIDIPRNAESSLPPGVWERTTERGKRKRGARRATGRNAKQVFVVHKQTKATGPKRRATGPKPKALLLFVKRPHYRRVFDMPATVIKIVQQRFDREFDKNFKRALATAR